MPLFLGDEDKREILKAIDAYAWKHSWHLPSGDYGLLWDDDTLEKVSEIMIDYRDKARSFANKLDGLIRIVADVQFARKMDEAD